MSPEPSLSFVPRACLGLTGQAKYHRWLQYKMQAPVPNPLAGPEDSTPANPDANLLAILEAEPTWTPTKEQAKLSYLGDADARDVYLGKHTCPLCYGSYVVEIEYVGETTGKRVISTLPCTCRRHQLYFSVIDPMIPKMYKDIDLSTLKPMEFPDLLSVERHAEIIEAVKARKKDSFIFIGPPRVGKTCLMMALLREAGRRWAHATWLKGGTPWPAVWYYHASTLLREHVAYVTQGTANPETAEPPGVTVAAIKSAVRNGHTPSLFLDDLHKVGPTPFQLETLHDLIDTMHENGGQIVVSTNEDQPWFQERWGKTNADAIWGRILEGDAHRVRFEDRQPSSAAVA